MAIRHQQRDEKHPYESPTTMGLYTTFRSFIIELVCLNVNRKLAPRFWSDTKYWGPKYRRETKGIANLANELNMDDQVVRTALVHVIKNNNIKSLTAKKTISRVIALTFKQLDIINRDRNKMDVNRYNSDIDIKENAKFVDTGEKTTISKIREMENG